MVNVHLSVAVTWWLKAGHDILHRNEFGQKPPVASDCFPVDNPVVF